MRMSQHHQIYPLKHKAIGSFRESHDHLIFPGNINELENYSFKNIYPILIWPKLRPSKNTEKNTEKNMEKFTEKNTEIFSVFFSVNFSVFFSIFLDGRNY